MQKRYPPIEPHSSGFLSVSGGHEVYWEESGNPKGKPVIFLHGGPGAGTQAKHREFFHPSLYRIILMDQRGCGKSRPHACLTENTTWHLVEDMETLRKHLQIESWMLFGGSWGSTLSLAYAQTHPSRVSEMILRGIFLGRPEEFRWFYESGAHRFFPEKWEEFISLIPLKERGNLFDAYYKRLSSDDEKESRQAAISWASWEEACLRLVPNEAMLKEEMQEDLVRAIARIECHYFVHRCFFSSDNFLLEGMEKISHIPAIIIQGRYDMICPPSSAWDLHRVWPKSCLRFVPDAGHSASETGIESELLQATLQFSGTQTS